MLSHLLFMAANYIMLCCLFVLGCFIITIIAFILFYFILWQEWVLLLDAMLLLARMIPNTWCSQ